MAIAQVVTLGECMALVYPDQPVTLDQASNLKLDLAGAESNLCIALSRLGITSRFITRVGMDPFGAKLRQVLDAEGVLTDGLIDDDLAPSGLFFREHLSDGRRRIYYYRKNSAASRMSDTDLRSEWFEGTRIVHLTGITPALSESCAAACRRAMALARGHGCLISFDPNYRAPLWSSDEARRKLAHFFEAADIILLGDEDARAVLGFDEVKRVLDQLTRDEKVSVVYKLGARGAAARIKGTDYHVPAWPARQVVDPVGAGDGFNAGFLAGLLRGWSAGDSLTLAARIGSAAVEVMGDYAGYPRGL